MFVAMVLLKFADNQGHTVLSVPLRSFKSSPKGVIEPQWMPHACVQKANAKSTSIFFF